MINYFQDQNSKLNYNVQNNTNKIITFEIKTGSLLIFSFASE